MSTIAKISYQPKPIIRPKLEIGKPGDRFEHEADAMADRVMAIPQQPSFVQRKCASCEEEDEIRMQPIEEEEEMIQPKLRMQPIVEEEEMLQPKLQMSSQEEEKEGMVQTKSKQGSKDKDVSLENKLSQAGSGTPLPGMTSKFMGAAFGSDFSHVRIHNGAPAARMNSELGARAFTHQNDIYFNQGEYQPESSDGKRLLAHELTHVVQQNGPVIRREAMPESSTVTDIESYTAARRQNTKYDSGFDLQSNISLYFQKGIIMDVRKGYKISFVVKGFSPGESWLEGPMKALALYTFNFDKDSKETPITGITTVQHLDLTGQRNPDKTDEKGPDADIRFTSSEFDRTGKGDAKVRNVQLLIEKLGNHSTSSSTEKPEERRKRFENTYQIYNTAPTSHDPLDFTVKSLTDSQYDMVLEGIDAVPVNILNSLKGIPIHGGSTDKGPKGEAAEYVSSKAKGSNTWERKITVYKQYFTLNLEQRKYIMVHELGHAADFRPNEGAGGTGKASASSSKAFRDAVKLDGGLSKGVSTYGKTAKDFDEYYAEAFTMYLNQPKTLKALRPNVYNYFAAAYP